MVRGVTKKNVPVFTVAALALCASPAVPLADGCNAQTNWGIMGSGSWFPNSYGTVSIDWTSIAVATRFDVGGDMGTQGGIALLSVTNGGSITVSDGYLRMYSSGTFTGNGHITTSGGTTIHGTRIDGTLSPSGSLSFYGDLTLTSTATTVSNVTPSGADNIEVHENSPALGTASLDGPLLVTMTGDFSSAPTRFLLLHAEGGLLNTNFHNVSIKYPTGHGWTPHITYDPPSDPHYVYLDRVYDLNP